jgi:hypothetical protein
VGKAKRAHQRLWSGGHGAQERAFAHPTNDSNRSKSAVVPVTFSNLTAVHPDGGERGKLDRPGLVDRERF